MRSVMKHQFSQVPQAKIPRSSFDRSHGHKTTFDAGYLVPIYVDEALPGDTFNLRMSAFARMSTPVFPIMDNLRMETFFFFVPTRLVWDNWQKFNGEQKNPGDSTDFVVPTFRDTAGTVVNEGEPGDYMGLPIGFGALTPKISSLPFRCYNLIWNEWFRDQNLQDSVTVDTGDGPDSYTSYNTLLRRGKRHDYFTSCLPWPQKGESVDIPLGTDAPVFNSGGTSLLRVGNQGKTSLESINAPSGAGETTFVGQSGAYDGATLRADLSNATAATINSLRQAFQIQKMLERDARGGSRYTEIIRAHFGVVSPDHRLQRPEYLGGGSSPIQVSQVPQTSNTVSTGDDASPQGNLAAYATAGFSGHGFSKSFTEHGYIIGLVNVRADLTYQYGINRMWSRRTRYDFYWPALSHIGEQAVLNKEIYYKNDAVDENVFGYQERYAEYRYHPSRISGKFRSNASGSLDVWHLAEKLSDTPALNSSWIEDNPPVARTLAVQNQPQFIFDSYFSLRCARPMPLYGVPGLIDHF